MSFNLSWCKTWSDPKTITFRTKLRLFYFLLTAIRIPVVEIVSTMLNQLDLATKCIKTYYICTRTFL